MKRQFVVAVAIVLGSSGVASAQTGTPQTNTFVGPGAPVISADSPPARNPAVNPSAAGLSQAATAAPHDESTYSTAKTPGVGRGGFTASQALASLRYYGCTDIANLHLDQKRHWRAQATHNGRRVKVVLDDRGTLTEQT